MAISTANRQTSRVDSIPAPIGGWNAREPFADMDPRDAILLKNFFPETGSVSLRKGYTQHVTGIGDQVESLFPYNEADGNQTLFAAAGTKFYDVTSSGAVGAAVVSSLTNARWQHVNFMNSSGTAYLCCFNGTDNPRYWDGSNWIEIQATGSPKITGVTTSNLDSPWIHKRRMWMVEKDSLSAWYLPVDAVGGAASEFDLSGLFKAGGYLIAGGTWTVDAGEGLDDYWIAVTSEGEVAVYSGTDPGSNFTIVGIWRVGNPIGKRCLMKYAGDLLIILQEGVFPISQALQSSRVDPRVAITNKINGAITEATDQYGSNFGWELAFFPGANMIILNVPVQTGDIQEQYVMNTITGAWGQFTNVKANCWAIFNGEAYFGGNEFVGQFWDGRDDNGDNIDGDIQQAFTYFGMRGALKRFTMIRPILVSNGSPEILATINVDYDESDPSAPLSFTEVTFATWDSGLWDTAIWGSDRNILKDWQSVTAIGTAASLRMKTASAGLEVSLQAVDYVYEVGGIL